MYRISQSGISCRRDHEGFSLIELLVVLVILGLLSGLVGPRLFTKVDSSKVDTAQTQVRMLKLSLQSYRLDVGQYPSTEQGLGSLISEPSGVKHWRGPYLEEALPADPWGNEYVYIDSAKNLQGFALYSRGADGADGGDELNADVGFLPE